MNLKESEGLDSPTGSTYSAGTSSARYCNSKYIQHMVVLDARTQQVLIDQLFSVPRGVRLARISESSYDLLTKIIRAVPKRYEGGFKVVVGENFTKLSEGNVSEFQKKIASGALLTELSTIDERDETHQITTEVEPLLDISGYWTWRNIRVTHGA